MNVSTVVNSVFTSKTFILTSDGCNDCWLVDIGDIEPVLEKVGEKSVKGVFITHTHYDHIYGLQKLIALYPDCLIYTSVDGKEGLASDKFNFSRYHGAPVAFESPNVRVLDEGDSVELFAGVRMTAALTPGHDRSCVTYHTDGAVFTGDSYIPGVEVVTTFPRSDKHASDVSLTRIHSLMEGRTVYPGHKV
ncbi:MAG: MBL fold metallo-hydrolase [Bacteroidales bacterium]|nr:MBL fold metallo-hydrolase [Bacteroidales bacterium]